MNAPAHSSINASAGAPARTLAPAGSSATTAEDWDTLFRAVRERLHLSANAPADQIQSIVGECVQALGQLHAMLAAERRPCAVPSLHALVIERFIKPLMQRERDSVARDRPMRGRAKPPPSP